MKSSYGVHCFCLTCGTNWSEYRVPVQCIYCDETVFLAYSRLLVNSDDYIGVVALAHIPSQAGRVMTLEQAVCSETTSTSYTVSLPLNVYSLDSFIFDWESYTVLGLDQEFLCSLEYYFAEVLEIP